MNPLLFHFTVLPTYSAKASVSTGHSPAQRE